MSAPPPRNVLPGSHLVIWPADDVIGVMMYQERGGCLDCEIAWRGADYRQALDFATRLVLQDGYDLVDCVAGKHVVWNEGGFGVTALPPNMRATFAAAAREYRGEPPLARPNHRLLRALLLDELGPVPTEALAAFVALDLGDDEEARERMSRVVALVKEAARLFNQLRAAESEAQ